MNERIRKIRDCIGLNQKDFSAKINIGKSTLAMFETGQRDLKDIHIAQICNIFNVNEEWLRTGKGEMFIQKDSTLVSKLSEEYNLDSLDIEIVKCYLELDPEQRSAIKSYVSSVAKAITYENDEVTATKDDIDKELESYRLELEAEKKGTISLASENGEDPKAN